METGETLSTQADTLKADYLEKIETNSFKATVAGAARARSITFNWTPPRRLTMRCLNTCPAESRPRSRKHLFINSTLHWR